MPNFAAGGKSDIACPKTPYFRHPSAAEQCHTARPMAELLNEDGRASIATAMMMSHHAFRRDLNCFSRALDDYSPGDSDRTDALREEWQFFRGALHGHHEMEDANIFPDFAKQSPEMAVAIEGLSSDHRKIDPLLEQGDRAFADAIDLPAAKSIVGELIALLDGHLTTEEATVIPHLRGVYAFPPPPDEAAAEMYAQGFAWSSHGIAPEVLEQVYAILPENLTSCLTAARRKFEERCVRVWGTAKTGSSRTSVPQG